MKITDLLDILAREERVMQIIKDELRAIKDKHGTPRLTQIVPDEGEISLEDLISNEGTIITITHNGFIKRTAVSAYRAQRRGGKGVITMKTGDKTGNVVGALTVTDNDEIMLTTNKGQMVRTRVKEIRETSRNTMGVKLIDLKDNEKLTGIAPVVRDEDEEEPEAEVTTPTEPTGK